jgi:hypothetical protein
MPPATAKTPATLREKMFWALIGTLAVGQLIAFWMLCSHQVSEAQAREATLQGQRLAGEPQPRDGHAALAATENNAQMASSGRRPTQVNFSLR